MVQLTGSTATPGDTSVVDDSAKVAVGTRMKDASGNEYIYLEGVASVEANSWVSFNADGDTELLVANAKGRVAIAMAAIVADKYGWFQVYGSATGKALTGFADGGRVYATATAGSVDDADVAGDLVAGAMGRSALSGGVATFELNYPFIDDAADD